jgi:uncharacterized membrane protein
MLKPLLALVLFHILLYAVIILNIPIIKQIIVFIYLSFIPGVALLRLLNLNRTMIIEKILFTVGLSLAFLMFVGLIINELFFALHISMPLTSTPLLISLSFLTLVLSIVAYRQDLTTNQNRNDNFLNIKDLAPKSVLIIPLILGVVGSLYTNVYVLSLMIISIVILFGLSIFSNRFSSVMSFPTLIFLVSLALTIQVLLTSRYIMGFDANAEFYVFKITANSGHWTLLSTNNNLISTVNLSGMLSVTILPTIYFSLMNCSGEVVFKSLYPFVFSLVPVALFAIYYRQFGKTASVLASIFFVSGSIVFYGVEPLSLDRQIIGTLFLALSILIIMNKSLSVGKRRLLLVVFGGALIVSHYSLFFIYLFIVISLYIILRIKKSQDNIVDFRSLLSLFIIGFYWYSYTNSILAAIKDSLTHIYYNFVTDFSVTSSRGLSGLHPAGSNINFAGDIYWIFYILVNLFLAIGVVRLLSGLLRKNKKWSIDLKYQIMIIISGFILLLSLIIPNLAPSLNFSRFYAITLLILSPCFVIGGELLVDLAATFVKRTTEKHFFEHIKKATKILLFAVIIGYFLTQSGFVNLVAGAAPLSFPLDYSRASSSSDPIIQKNFNSMYIPEQSALSASWLFSHKVDSVGVFPNDISGFHALVSYGLIPDNLIFIITNSTITLQSNYIYLGSLKIMNGAINSSISFNASQISSLLNQNNLIYTNGISEIFYVNPSP